MKLPHHTWITNTSENDGARRLAVVVGADVVGTRRLGTAPSEEVWEAFLCVVERGDEMDDFGGAL
jgi:hypothetical protein